MTSGIVEDMKITQENIQENLNLNVPIPSSTPLIYRDLMNLVLSRFIEYCLQHFILSDYLFMGLCKPNRNWRAHLKGPLSFYLNKDSRES